MPLETLEREIEKLLNQSAVTFDTDRRYNNQKAWPFWYPFVPKPYLETDTLNAGLGLLGITIPAGQTKDINIELDRDTVYRQLNVKYTAFRCALGEPVGALTMTTAVNDATVTPSALTGLTVGQHIAWIDDAGAIRHGVIASIDTGGGTVELEQVAVSVATAVDMHSCEYLWYDDVPATTPVNDDLTGTITIAPGGAALAGAGTNFDPEIAVGDVIQATDADGQIRFFQIATRTNDTTATITETLAAGDPGIAAGSTFKKVGSVQVGTLDVDATTRICTGVGTFWRDGDNTGGKLYRGDILFYPNAAGVVQRLPVGDIDTDTQMKTMQATVTDSGGAQTYALATATDTIGGAIVESSNAPVMDNISGTSFTIPISSSAVTGVGTVFTEQFRVGDRFSVVDAGGTRQIFTVAAITDDLTMTIAETTGGTAGTDNVAATSAGENMPFLLGPKKPNNLFHYRPLTQFIRVSYIMSSLRGRYLYGGSQEYLDPNNPDNSGLRERPHLISALQGVDDGLGMLRTPAVFPYQANCRIRVTNNYTEDIVINGTLFGYKISLGDI